MMLIDIPYTIFFDQNSKSSSFDAALLECINEECTLRFSLGQNIVRVQAEQEDTPKGGIELNGRWRSQILASATHSSGTLMLAPFFFWIEEMCIPHSMIYTMGKPHRSISDFFMRNLFFAAGRNDIVNFKDSPLTKGTTLEGSRQLARRYTWIFKSLYKDPVFGDANVLEMLLANVHLPLFEFENMLLENGAVEYRSKVAQTEGMSRMSDQKERAMLIRKKVMSRICD